MGMSPQIACIYSDFHPLQGIRDGSSEDRLLFTVQSDCPYSISKSEMRVPLLTMSDERSVKRVRVFQIYTFTELPRTLI